MDGRITARLRGPRAPGFVVRCRRPLRRLADSASHPPGAARYPLRRPPMRAPAPAPPTARGRIPAGRLPSFSMTAAVVLMAYGSPERLTDVPAYYADIRGGRPIAPEHLDDLVSRYSRLGIEQSNPLNAITEETRAALEDELALPVLTGMKHWHPRI